MNFYLRGYKGGARACMRSALLMGAMLCVTGCSMFGGNSREDALGKLKWSYAEDAISINWDASEALNRYEHQPHTLLLLVVQMNDPNVYKQYVLAPGGIATLLAASAVPKGFVDMQRIFIQPGDKGSVSLARAEGAQYVGVVAGYYSLNAPTVARLYRIGVDVVSHGWIVKSRTAAPEPLKIRLRLGPDGLLGGETSPLAAQAPEQPKAGEVPLKPEKTPVDKAGTQ